MFQVDTSKRYALLISGGVDSAVACHLLCEAGIRPDLYYIKIGMQGEGTSCSAEEDIELSTLTARKYNLPLQVVDLQQTYHERVTAYVIDRIRKGLTPNPDVMCNRLIKFGAFHERVGHDYDFIASGHYAQTFRDEQQCLWLAPAPDPVKDQSDFLSQLTDVQAEKLCFPIGHLLKQEVRNIAERENLAPTVATAKVSVSWAKSTTTTTCAHFWASRRATSSSGKRDASSAATMVIGFTPSASARGSDWAAAHGLSPAKTSSATSSMFPIRMPAKDNTATISASQTSISSRATLGKAAWSTQCFSKSATPNTCALA